MGRKAHCTSAEPLEIQQLKNSGKSYQEISRQIGLCRNGFKLQKNVRGRKRKTTLRENKLIIRETKMDPSISSNTIKNNLKLILMSRKITGRLIEANLLAITLRSVNRSVLLLKKQYAKTRKEFFHKYSA